MTYAPMVSTAIDLYFCLWNLLLYSFGQLRTVAFLMHFILSTGLSHQWHFVSPVNTTRFRYTCTFQFTDNVCRKWLPRKPEDRRCFPGPYSCLIWHTGLLARLSKSLRSWVVQTIELLLRNSCFWVHMSNDISSAGLDLVPAPTTCPTFAACHNLAYADDICCTTHAETFVELECTLTADLAQVTQ